MSGDFNGWSGYSNPLADADNDGVWEGTFYFRIPLNLNILLTTGIMKRH